MGPVTGRPALYVFQAIPKREWLMYILPMGEFGKAHLVVCSMRREKWWSSRSTLTLGHRLTVLVDWLVKDLKRTKLKNW